VVVVNTVASGWHTSVVASPTEIVFALKGSFGAAFWKPPPIRRDLVYHPVNERLVGGCIRIVADDRYFLGPLGKCAPLQGRGDILTLSCVLLGMVAPDSKAELDTSMVTIFSSFSRAPLCGADSRVRPRARA
jgi:hypothetical protein